MNLTVSGVAIEVLAGYPRVRVVLLVQRVSTYRVFRIVKEVEPVIVSVDIRRSYSNPTVSIQIIDSYHQFVFIRLYIFKR